MEDIGFGVIVGRIVAAAQSVRQLQPCLVVGFAEGISKIKKNQPNNNHQERYKTCGSPNMTFVKSARIPRRSQRQQIRDGLL